MKSLTGFLTRLLLFSAVIAIVQALIASSIPDPFHFDSFRGLQLFFVFATLVFHLGLLKAANRSDQAFIRYFMGATGIKLLFYMGIMIVYATVYREHAVAFISNFFALYLLYTAFEVALVYNKFSKMSGR